MTRPEKESHSQRDFRNLAILLLVALCLGVYLIATTAVIARDSVRFIQFAGQLDIAAGDIILKEDQHPGYPWLILTTHKALGVFHENTSVRSWIGCAQSVSLVFRLLAIGLLYFIGKHLFTGRISFWAVLIFILLPDPAEYGSDALSDWPHLFFLMLGFLCLLKGASSQSRGLLGLAGLAAGAGYLIRPECAQVVIFGSLWLGWQLIVPKHKIETKRTAAAFVLLLAGFLVAAGPYMHFKGALFPKKNVGRFVHCPQAPSLCEENISGASKALHVSQAALSDLPKAVLTLVGNIGDTLMWFFAVPLLIGIQTWYKKQKWCEPEMFLIANMIIFNILLMLWLYSKHGYMSNRHTLPLVVLTIPFMASGLQQIADWFEGRFPKNTESTATANGNNPFWFFLLFAVGACVCAPRLLRPIRIEKQGYNAAAQWLADNTTNTDSIAVPDIRIGFYAGRDAFVYKKEKVPTDSKYVVAAIKDSDDSREWTMFTGKQVYEYTQRTEDQVGMVIFYNPERPRK